MAKNWYLLGDIHAQYFYIENFIRRHPDYNFDGSDKIILLGDAGFNFYLGDPKYKKGKADEKFKEKMSSFPFIYYVVRGNHEERPSKLMHNNPENWEIKFDEEADTAVIVEKAFPNIRYFLDGPSTATIAGYRTLILPGAYSVDKYYRLENNWSWFKEEQMTEQEMKLTENVCQDCKWNVDLILSHTCPICFEPTDLFLKSIDQSTVEKEMERFFGRLEYKLDYKAWCWGHFHTFRDYPRIDGKRKLMLYCDELVELNQFMSEDYVKKE